MKKVSTIYILILVFVQFVIPGNICAMEPLTDDQLDAITAGSMQTVSQNSEALTRIPFQYTTGKGQVDGEVIVMPMANYNQTGTLHLMDNAQSNLRSLININAVNSPVQILLNLNININSEIGKLNQWNILLPGTE